MLESLFQNLLKKRLWHSCIPVNFVKFLKIPFSQNTSCSLGDCCFFLLIFLSPSFHLFVASYTIGTLYSVSLFYNLTNFVIAVAIFPVFYFFFLKLNLFPALHLCSVLPFCRLSVVRLCYWSKSAGHYFQLFLARQNATRIFRIKLNIMAFYHSG